MCRASDPGDVAVGLARSDAILMWHLLQRIVGKWHYFDPGRLADLALEEGSKAALLSKRGR